MNLQASFLLSACLSLWLALPGHAQSTDDVSERPLVASYQRAQDAVQRADWDAAWVIGAQEGRLIHDYVEWHWLRAGRGNPSEVLSFLDRRADWPGLALLRRRAEASLDIATHDEVLRLFADSLPQTGRGALALAEALEAEGQDDLAENVLINAWVRLRMDEAEEAAYMVGHTRLLAPYHAARLDQRLWEGDTGGARRLLPLVSETQRSLALARMALANGNGEVTDALADVPESHRGDPGLAYAEYDWLIRARNYDAATELLARQSVSAAHLGQPEAWANWRRWLTRRQLQEGDDGLAYWLAATHYLDSGGHFADLEFLAGYIALKRLDRPRDAAGHFSRLAEGVSTPISLSRAHYWHGEALRAAGDMAGAETAYAEAGRYWTAFYGQLALDRLGQSLPMDVFSQQPSDWRNAAFRDDSVWQLATLAFAAGDRATAMRFYTHLVEGLDESDAARLAAMAEEFNDPNLALEIAKRAASGGRIVASGYFPLHPMHRANLGAPPERALAIARRESEFRVGLTSPAGAEGMMQLMPGTSRAMAEAIGVAHEPERVLDDWLYNALLGSAYLVRMAEEFDDNPVMIAAAYNAGPSRPREWMETNGDPRRGEIDIIDWIEMIPFRETRNYVMRVTEAEAVYAARLGHPVGDFRQWLASTDLAAEDG